MRNPFAGYSDGRVPLLACVGLVGAFHALFAGTALLLRRRGRLPARPRLADVVLAGVATEKITRIIAKDWVTAPLRAPFTEFVEDAGRGEVVERPRQGGMRQAMGALLTCAYCLGPWTALLLVAGMSAAPRLTRLATATFTAVAVSDALHEVTT